MKLKIVAVTALISLNLFILSPAAQWADADEELWAEDERSQSGEKTHYDKGSAEWDNDRKLLAQLGNNKIKEKIENLSIEKNRLNQQIKRLSQRYGNLISKDQPDKAAIFTIEAQQIFVIKQLQRINDYIEELEYQKERNDGTDQA